MTREEAIVWCDRFNNAWANADPKDDFPDLKYSDTLDQLFYLAGQAIRQQEHFREVTKKVEPLTLDELRQMDGDPVYIVDGDLAWWDIVSYSTKYFLMLVRDEAMPFIRYGKTWLAYRQKPVEDRANG